MLRKTALLALLCAPPFYGYSVLTHEAVIDSLWDSSVAPMLLRRFPDATPEDLRKAHAYAYGGCIIQDLGYYPFGNHFFSDLTHYVRSGDFVAALIREARDVNEYAFALGALAHYASDNNGHKLATNRAVGVLYPKLAGEFGPQVTFWDKPSAHLKTEFGFDVLQVAAGEYASEDYRDFIGFEISEPVLERAFYATYGIEFKDVFANTGLTVGTFRFSVGSLIPNMTKVAWSLKGDDIQKRSPGITREKFLYSFTRQNYEDQWGAEYDRPGIVNRVIAFFLRIIPKIGPLKSLAFRVPTPEVEEMFQTSFRTTVDNYRGLMVEARDGRARIPNMNLDLGEAPHAGNYAGCDETYDELLEKLEENGFATVPPDLRADILEHYRGRRAPVPEVTSRLNSLRSSAEAR